MYLCVEGIDFSSFYDIQKMYWNLETFRHCGMAVCFSFYSEQKMDIDCRFWICCVGFIKKKIWQWKCIYIRIWYCANNQSNSLAADKKFLPSPPPLFQLIFIQIIRFAIAIASQITNQYFTFVVSVLIDNSRRAQIVVFIWNVQFVISDW